MFRFLLPSIKGDSVQLRVKGITADQHRCIVQMKKDGVYKRTSKSSQQEGQNPPVSVTVACGDALKLLKFLKFHGRGVGELVHPVTLIGGGAAFHPKSPLNGPHRFPLGWQMHQIRLASKAMGNTKIVSEYMHCPCGGCNEYGISLPQQVELNFLGLGILREESQRDGFVITPYAHIYYGIGNEFDPKEDETFEMDLDAWFEARGRYATELNQLPCRLTEFPALA